MSLWQRDELFQDRYRIIGGRSRVAPGIGGLLVWNFGDAENAVVVVSGAKLPEEARRYTWSGLSKEYGGIVDGYALDVFCLHDVPEDLSPLPRLYDGNGNWIWA